MHTHTHKCVCPSYMFLCCCVGCWCCFVLLMIFSCGASRWFAASPKFQFAMSGVRVVRPFILFCFPRMTRSCWIAGSWSERIPPRGSCHNTLLRRALRRYQRESSMQQLEGLLFRVTFCPLDSAWEKAVDSDWRCCENSRNSHR